MDEFLKCIYVYNRLSHKKGSSTDTCYNINESWKYYAMWKKPDFVYCIQCSIIILLLKLKIFYEQN